MKFFEALETSDAAAAKAMTIVSDPSDAEFIETLTQIFKARREMAQALHKAFPEDESKPEDEFARVRDGVLDAQLEVDGDLATLTPDETPNVIQLKKIDGAWKVNLSAMPDYAELKQTAPQRKQVVAAMQRVTKDIAAEKFVSIEEARAAVMAEIGQAIQPPSTSQLR